MQDTETTNSESAVPQLSAMELRVLGALMEKQLTTPDQYPLTVNSILTACNQKSSRDPITNYAQGELLRTLQILEDKRFIRKEYGSRADKYSQLFMQHLELGKKQQALLCLLMLRGPQTISELNTRSQRMELFSDKNDLTHCIERLCEREIPYAIKLGHQPGQRGDRYAMLFCGTPAISQSGPGETTNLEKPQTNADDQETLTLLQLEITELNQSLMELKKDNQTLRHQLEMLYELTGHTPTTPS